jgi:hypothetical protein
VLQGERGEESDGKAGVARGMLAGSMSIVRDVLRRIVKNDYDNCLSLEYSTMKSHNLLRDVDLGISPLCLASSRGNAKAVACLLTVAR